MYATAGTFTNRCVTMHFEDLAQPHFLQLAGVARLVNDCPWSFAIIALDVYQQIDRPKHVWRDLDIVQ